MMGGAAARGKDTGPLAEWDSRYIGQRTRGEANGCAGGAKGENTAPLGRRRGAGRFVRSFVLVPPRIRAQIKKMQSQAINKFK